MPETAARRPKQAPLIPRLKLWLEVEGGPTVGLGLCEILQAVDRARSMKRAACCRNSWSRRR